MSHKATNWAIQQRGIKPASKIVLWHLCDRFHPDHGCYPSQATLAHDCEMSRASINRCIDELVEKGLVKRHPRIDPITKKQTSTWYTFAFQETVSQNDTRDGEAVSQKQADPCLKNGDSRVSICDTNPVREPIREPVSARERADDLFSEETEGQKPDQTEDLIEEGFTEFWANIWPRHERKAGKADCRKVYDQACRGKHPKADKIAPAELNAAARRFIASVKDKQYLPGPLPWLRKPGWEPFISGPDGAPPSGKPMSYAQRLLAGQAR